jgi:hypothetical protein
MATHLQITVDLELGATPIEGQISTETQPSRPFHGWLELASVIEQLRVASRPPTHHAASQGKRSDTALRKERQ